jgi:hypothetical protein
MDLAFKDIVMAPYMMDYGKMISSMGQENSLILTARLLPPLSASEESTVKQFTLTPTALLTTVFIIMTWRIYLKEVLQDVGTAHGSIFSSLYA